MRSQMSDHMQSSVGGAIRSGAQYGIVGSGMGTGHVGVFGKSFRNQAKATFEDAKATNRGVYYKFDSQPAQSIVEKLNEYSLRYNVKLKISY
ncbi:hypothetical protein ASG22_20440 [Chryseobacterium sp. Leaf405]|uniref:restriction endonuclease fold toxin n=1 Tax=Chryseobacterium sp. Leaf405 TaxID=1736367 RepID=UPI000700E10D|nr:restriction endonuclease fold toxin [Chryseobacterium sp. Leaf405]KQT27027.1 hypothetical protein ASG22_20440 [Chryseobacterium sp. Leaf405]